MKKLEGNLENPNKKAIKELSWLDDMYEKGYGHWLDDLDIENEKDEKLIERIREKFKVEKDETIKFMPQYIFAKNLRIIVEDRKIKHTEFEEKYGLGAKMLSKYINGHQFPNLTVMCKIAYGLDMSVYQLLGMSKFTSLPAEEINNKIGLSEKAMKILFMLRHNIGECNELTDDVPVSNQHKIKLDIFNSFIEDNVNFLKFLNCLEQYTRLKEQLKNIEKDEDEEIKYKLLRITRRVN